MKKEWYQFANHINSYNEIIEEEGLDDMTKERYKRNILAAIRNEQQGITKNNQSKKHNKIAAAAICLVFLGSISIVFHNEVYAAISHISYSLSSALGLEDDLAQYTEVVNTSVHDKGYVVTLQEAAAAEEKLLISYTVQREDGQPFTDNFCLNSSLYVNGSIIYGSASGSEGFLDDEKKCLGGEISYDVLDIDLSCENTYEIKFTASNDFDAENDIKGHWNFKFKADGTELFADTKHMTLGNEFKLPSGETITLDTLSINALEQRITFHSSTKSMGRYDLRLTAVDDQGRTAEFYISRFGGGKGYMLNSEIIEDGRISDDAKTVTITVSVVELPEGNGKISDNYINVGEAFIWEMSNLK